MSLASQVYFSLYKGSVETPAPVFEQRIWTLDNGVRLNVRIIGKSHCATFCSARGEMTEMIAYPVPGLPKNPLAHFHLQVGNPRHWENRTENLIHRISVQALDRLFDSMDEFLDFMEAPRSTETLQHEFGNRGAFTGIAVENSLNSLYTIHTYPEDGTSILSKTELALVA